MWWSSNLTMPYIKINVVYVHYKFLMFLFVRTIHASGIIHSLLPSPLSLELSSESGLRNVIHFSYFLDFDLMVLLGLNWLPTVWLVPR